MKTITINGEKFLCSSIKNGEGKFSKCYLTPSREVLKVYRPDLLFEQFCYVDNLLPITGVKNDTFIFPNRLMADDEGRVLAYVSEYVPNMMIKSKHFLNIIEQMISSVNKAYEDILKISEMRIFADNISPKSIIFNKRFYVIGTNDYFMMNGLSKEECIANNLSLFNDAVIRYVQAFVKDDNVLFNSIIRNNNLKFLELQMIDENNPQPLLVPYLQEFANHISYYKEGKKKLKHPVRKRGR